MKINEGLTLHSHPHIMHTVGPSYLTLFLTLHRLLFIIYDLKNLGRGSPLSARASKHEWYQNNMPQFYGTACILIYSNKMTLYTSPPPSATVVAHFTSPSGREGNTPPHPHPRGVTMHLAPETTMTIHSWLTDDSPPGSQLLLFHTMLPTRMLSSHTALPPGSRCHSLVTPAYRTWGFSNTLLTAPCVGLTNTPCMPPPLGLTLPHCHLPLGGAP